MMELISKLEGKSLFQLQGMILLPRMSEKQDMLFFYEIAKLSVPMFFLNNGLSIWNYIKVGYFISR
jgi:hypothetical protein